MTPSPDSLDHLLTKWGRPPAVPPLSAEVWRRVAAAEAAVPVAGWRPAVCTAFTRPSFAVAFIAACMLLGMFLAEMRVSRQHRARDVELIQSYLRLIDPLVAAPPAPARDARS